MMKIDVALPGATEAEAKAEPETEPTPTYENLLGARKKVSDDPFATPSESTPHWKVLLWGDTGTLKSRTALHFPAPCVLDLERGTQAYRAEFDFRVREVGNDVDKIMETIVWLRDSIGKNDYRTFVCDPISAYYFALQRKWNAIFMNRLRGRKGHKHEWFEWGPKEYQTVKAEAQALTTALCSLPLNVVCTAHNKLTYASGGGEIMTVTGESFDGDKKLSRPFDIIIHLMRDPDGTCHWNVIKDRTSRLPQTLTDTTGGADYFAAIETAIGKEALDQPSEPIEQPTPATLRKIRRLLIERELPEAKISARLETYGANSFLDLSRAQAKEILEKLSLAKEAK